MRTGHRCERQNCTGYAAVLWSLDKEAEFCLWLCVACAEVADNLVRDISEGWEASSGRPPGTSCESPARTAGRRCSRKGLLP